MIVVLKKFFEQRDKYCEMCRKDPKDVIKRTWKNGLLAKVLIPLHIFDVYCTYTSSKIIDFVFDGIYAKQIKIARKKAITQIEKMNFSDLKTKEILIALAGITNEHYKNSKRISNYINEIRKNASENNLVVQKRIEEITGMRGFL